MTVQIQNIRADDVATFDLRAEIVAGLKKPAGKRNLPTVVLYDEDGLRLYDEITTKAKEYYLFASEEEILRKNAGDVVSTMPKSASGATVLELGAGALRKTSHLLKAFAQHAPGTTYYALDLEHRELVRTLEGITAPGSELSETLDRGRVDVRGLCGTYEDGIRLLNQGGLRCDPAHFDRPWDVQARGRRASNAGSRQAPAPRASSSSPNSSLSDMSSPSHMESGSGSDAASSGYITPPTPVSEEAESSPPKPLHILFLGSSVGNFPRDDAATFLRSLPLNPGDTLLMGLDGRNAKELVEPAYRDPAGHTERFIMNGLKSVARVLGLSEEELSAQNWTYESRFNDELGRHEAYYKCTKPHSVRLSDSQKVSFAQDELVHIENAHKYSDEDAHALFDAARLRPAHRWQDPRKLYSLYLLERPAFYFPLIRQPVAPAAFGLPAVGEWQEMWRVWDAITLGMIPRDMLHVKPIDLRHICLFYLGHIPAFLDIHLSRLLKEPHTEPEHYKYIFERGIDPHVDDPSQCHPHSEVPTRPEDWPALDEILAFRDRVRERVLKLYEDVAAGRRKLTRKMARVLFMTLEHEGFHAETLLYMLLQRAGPPAPSTLPPPGLIHPPWELLKAEWDAAPKLQDATVELGPSEVVLGHDDAELEDEENAPYEEGDEFGWDNESPKRVAQIGRVWVSWRCITNGEYLAFWEERQREVETPKSWVLEDGQDQPKVRTLYGPIDLDVARDWPVLASYDALSVYATAKGGRLPTEPELRLFADRFQHSNAANVGFRRWHCIPGTTGQAQTDGKGHNGGAWEWTSTVLAAHEGFAPSRLYPGYSSDFFDGKHMVVLGGSYATIPRIAQRRSVRNFYQHNYPYAWVAGRVVYDA
ncbi:hypothetical protein AURDEDRAFT_115403 [Auricularia subglabra TFB-10046 SS5]|nr:hypothetical protein AURDEDRAFT_115403 [Auricularia subglabra TFB-10046 SS5]